MRYLLRTLLFSMAGLLLVDPLPAQVPGADYANGRPPLAQLDNPYLRQGNAQGAAQGATQVPWDTERLRGQPFIQLGGPPGAPFPPSPQVDGGRNPGEQAAVLRLSAVNQGSAPAQERTTVDELLVLQKS